MQRGGTAQATADRAEAVAVLLALEDEEEQRALDEAIARRFVAYEAELAREMDVRPAAAHGRSARRFSVAGKRRG